VGAVFAYQTHTKSKVPTMTSSFTTLRGDDQQNYITAVRGQSDSILLYGADDTVDGIDGNDRVVGGLGNDTLEIFSQEDAPGFAFSLVGAQLYGDGYPNSLAGGSDLIPNGNDSIDISLPGRGPQVFLGATSSLIDGGDGNDTIFGWSNINLSSIVGGGGADQIRWGYGRTINADKISSTINDGLF